MDSCHHDSSDNTDIAAIASCRESVICFSPRSELGHSKMETVPLVVAIIQIRFKVGKW